MMMMMMIDLHTTTTTRNTTTSDNTMQLQRLVHILWKLPKEMENKGYRVLRGNDGVKIV